MEHDMNEKLVSVVIPFYNEEQNVNRVMEDLEKSFEQNRIRNYEIVAVNNGSWDRTAEILRAHSQRNSRVRVVTVPKNQGLGFGVLQGFNEARGDYIGFNGGDGQVTGDDIVKVYRKLMTDGFDLCKVKRIVRQDGFERRVISFVFNWLSRILFGVKTNDVNGLPKIMKREVLERLQLVSRDWFIDAEIMIKARQMALKVGEVEIQFLKREGGRSHVNYGTVLEFLKNMLVYRLKGFPSREDKV
jgi:glycosyltransferase involved in cell wall biosynthesis